MPADELFRYELAAGYREPLVHGRFVGRARELHRLTRIFEERSAATVLVAGFRGAGKTALVEEALGQSGSKKQLVVRIAPPHLVREEGAPPVRSQVLRSLARGLYFEASQANKMPARALEQIESVYDKANLTEAQDHHVLERVAEASSASDRSTTIKTSVEFSRFVKVFTAVVVAALVGTFGAVTLAEVAERVGDGWAVTAAVAVLLLSLLAGFSVSKSSASSETITDVLTEKDSKTRLSRLDLSDATLEHELRLALSTLAGEQFSVVFVLDELDKLTLNDQTESDVQATAIFDILASLKNFFTLGSAVYVFITDDEFFEKLSLDHHARTYSASHTIFTDTVYVGPLHYRDVERLIDTSVVKPKDEPAYHQFKNFVCWESNNHAFDALQIISSYEEQIDRKTCLVPTESGEFEGSWREGNLPNDWLTRAALQKHVGVAYDDGMRSGPRESIFNQALWDTLHSAAAQLLDGDDLCVTDEGVQEVTGRFLESLGDEENTAVRAAVHRMLIRMERYGAVSEEEVEFLPAGEDAAGVPAQAFTVVASVPYPPSSIKSDAVLLPVEQTLVHAVERIDEMIASAPDGFQLEQNDVERLLRIKNLVRQLRESGPRQTQKRSVVDRSIREAESIADRLLRAATRTVATNWIGDVGATERPALAHANPRAPEQWLTELEADFGPLLAVLREGDFDFLLATGAHNAVLVVLFPDESHVEALRKAYQSCLAKDEKSRAERERLLPLVLVGISDELSGGSQVPTEVVTYLVEERNDGILAKLFGSGPWKSKKQKTVPTQGWEFFGTDPTLSNILDLRRRLDEVSFIR